MIDRHLRQQTGLISTDQSGPEDIFVVGYPKSGNTWVQHLLAGAIFGIDMRHAPAALVQDIIPDVHATRYYRRFSPVTFFKSHHLPRSRYRRVIYLVRDGRDAMVSYFHHIAAMAGAEPDFHRMIAAGEGLFPCRWHEHVEQWMANPYRAELIKVSYEKLKNDPVGELQRICDFAGLQRELAVLEMAAHTCSFELMREKEQKFGWGDRDAWPRHKAFMRRGIAGSFKDEMPPQVLDTFMKLSGPALRLAGYGE